MKYFPVFLNLQGRLCVVLGGGAVAERKVRTLLETGARVKVISPELTAGLSRFEKKGRIEYRCRSFRRTDLRGAFLAIAATSNRAVNELVFRQGIRQKIPVNVVDDPEQSSFIVPSLVKRGDLILAVSTSGKSPALAKALRRRLEKEIGPEYTLWLKLLRSVRQKILPMRLGLKQNQRIFQRLTADDVLHLIRGKRWTKLEAMVKEIVGPEFKSGLGRK